MTHSYWNKVIFAIDDPQDLHSVAKFLRHIDTCRANQTLKGSFVQCIGMYKGLLEPSYMMDERDYLQLVETLWFVDNQDCILHVPGDSRQPSSLEAIDKSWAKTLAPMREVTYEEASKEDSWTYVISTGKYFVTS